MKRTWSIILAAVAMVVLVAIYSTRTGHAPTGQPSLIQMDSSALSALQAEFNRSSASLRIILLLSPT